MATERADPPRGDREERGSSARWAGVVGLFAPYKRRALKAFALGVAVWIPFGIAMLSGGSAEISLPAILWAALAGPGLLLSLPLAPVADAIRHATSSNWLIEGMIDAVAVALNGFAYAAVAVVPWMIRDGRRRRVPR